MKTLDLIKEANVAAKIKDPAMIKKIYIAMTNDGSIPKSALARLGVRPTPEQALQLWSQLLDGALSRTRYGDVSADGKFDEWLTRLYTNGQADYEDISGEGGDALGAWKALSIRGKLAPEHQDFNKFRSIKNIQQIINKQNYREELRRIADAEVIEKHKRERKEVVLIDDSRFLVVLPLNYGACYTFNNSAGYQANFCTGSSSGLRWFQNYAPDGPVISVTDKTNMDHVEGKWQLHAQTRQIVDADQTRRHDTQWNDERFSKLFPGLMKAIGSAMMAKADELHDGSKELTNGKGYDVAKDVGDLQKTYPLSWASEPEKQEETPDQGPGTYLVTHTPTGRTARIEGESAEDVKSKLQARHPTANMEEFTFTLDQPRQQEPANDQQAEPPQAVAESWAQKMADRALLTVV
jgi:hypothetical protein